jgi:uncharacterized protein (TIGR02679 family)
MTKDVDPRLMRLLGGAELATLRKRLHRHFQWVPEDTPGMPAGTPGNVFRLGKLSPAEHTALASLMGRSPRFTQSMQIDVEVIDSALRHAGIAASLRDAMEQLEGPIVHLASMRAELHSRWSALSEGCRHPSLSGLLRTSSGLGKLKRLARQDLQVAGELCGQADRVLQRLPSTGIPRAQLAADTLGDAHALDAGRAVATLIISAWQHPSAPSDSPMTIRVRDIWASAGVLVNELARPALFLNLPAVSGEHPQPLGQPGYLSLGTLLRSPPCWDVAGIEIYVCENPNLVAIAADQLGCNCAPMMCTDGMPSAAQRALLTQLNKGGARLMYHGDFDWPGLQIANEVMGAYGASPWRFGAADYSKAVNSLTSVPHRLAGAPVDAVWDLSLSGVMQAHGVAIAEEALAASLIPDLLR